MLNVGEGFGAKRAVLRLVLVVKLSKLFLVVLIGEVAVVAPFTVQLDLAQLTERRI